MAACAVALVAALAIGGASAQAMESQKLGKHLCKTRGGGKFVKVPGAHGTRIDQRLLKDVRWMMDKFDLRLGDGYAPTGHAAGGEHPIGLALDIFAGNGRNSGWNKVDKLAKLAEPRQNQPKLPWRWVGYDGDSGHGRGNHLHLSWGHNDRTKPKKPAKWVLTRTCPGPGGGMAAVAAMTAAAGSARARLSSTASRRRIPSRTSTPSPSGLTSPLVPQQSSVCAASVSTTSNALPGMSFRSESASSSQRLSDAPVM